MKIASLLRGLARTAAALSLVAGIHGVAYAQATPHTIVFGVAPGPYGDLIKQAIAPSLEKKGYRIVVKEFSDYVQPNLALANGATDANLFQHGVYLEKFSADKGLKLSPLIRVPTAGLGLYSNKIKSLDELKKGDVVTLANDPTNLARALRFLAKLDLLSFKKDIDPTKASEKDIDQNPRGLVFKPLEAAQLPRTLDTAAASVVNGNFAIAAGLDLNKALKLEVLDENLKNLVAVKTEDLDKPFVKDIKAAVESEEFIAVVTDPKTPFASFQRPEWLVARLAHRHTTKK
ncbi:MetQ/NlpA family ABC transporter substrate-binding protein [uncultured Propionivibrio sp.]|uniref:MetQ/NlpA family ABC transporter substrate-binding protein n=1 Tax=uncultured Propionivibrio sp. TaxID=426737 RepID=UPI0029C054B2|nr:MetQ/NlpA family ABC transporter substrate-binding protein [uncultured Propionivibrio sp.]